jgi:hypothetical protein
MNQDVKMGIFVGYFVKGVKDIPLIPVLRSLAANSEVLSIIFFRLCSAASFEVSVNQTTPSSSSSVWSFSFFFLELFFPSLPLVSSVTCSAPFSSSVACAALRPLEIFIFSLMKS